MFIYQKGSASEIAFLFILMLFFCFLVGFIVPRRRKKDRKIVNLKAFVYKTLAGIGAAVVGVECYIKLTGLVMRYFVTLNSGTSENIGWAPYETAAIFTIVVALAYLLLMVSFGLGNRLKSKVVIHY